MDAAIRCQRSVVRAHAIFLGEASFALACSAIAVCSFREVLEAGEGAVFDDGLLGHFGFAILRGLE